LVLITERWPPTLILVCFISVDEYPVEMMDLGSDDDDDDPPPV